MNITTLEPLAEKVLEKIRGRSKRPIDPARLSKTLKVSKEEIAVAVELLMSWGYIIKIDKDRRYLYCNAPDSLISTEISHGLKTKVIGRKICSFKSVQSTNIVAHQLVVAKALEGTLVVAEHQTKGRGRLGRSWHSPVNVGLYCSIILRPRIHPTLAPGISLIAAVAVADTIAACDSLDIKIKWPNDVLISGRKTAGILTELSAELDRVTSVVVGIGINVNQKKADFPKELKNTATSIRMASKKEIQRVELLQRLLRNFEKEYMIFKKSGLEKSRKKILKYSSLLNTEVDLRVGRKVIRGRAIDIDRSGRLVMETPDGIKSFNAGEVTTH